MNIHKLKRLREETECISKRSSERTLYINFFHRVSYKVCRYRICSTVMMSQQYRNKLPFAGFDEKLGAYCLCVHGQIVRKFPSK